MVRLHLNRLPTSLPLNEVAVKQLCKSKIGHIDGCHVSIPHSLQLLCPWGLTRNMCGQRHELKAGRVQLSHSWLKVFMQLPTGDVEIPGRERVGPNWLSGRSAGKYRKVHMALLKKWSEIITCKLTILQFLIWKVIGSLFLTMWYINCLLRIYNRIRSQCRGTSS